MSGKRHQKHDVAATLIPGRKNDVGNIVETTLVFGCSNDVGNTTLWQRYPMSRPKYNQDLTLLQRCVPAGTECESFESFNLISNYRECTSGHISTYQTKTSTKSGTKSKPVQKVEILIAMRSVMSHVSHNKLDDFAQFYKIMFTDSVIASDTCLGHEQLFSEKYLDLLYFWDVFL